MWEGGMLDWVEFNILNLMGLKYYLHKFWIHLQVSPWLSAGPDLLNLEFRCSQQEWLGFETSVKIMCLHHVQYVRLVKHAPFTLSPTSSNCLQQLCTMYPSYGAQWHTASINHLFSNQFFLKKPNEQSRGILLSIIGKCDIWNMSKLIELPAINNCLLFVCPRS